MDASNPDTKLQAYKLIELSIHYASLIIQKNLQNQFDDKNAKNSIKSLHKLISKIKKWIVMINQENNPNSVDFNDVSIYTKSLIVTYHLRA